ncbi:MAG: hypothetical protein J1G01_01630 [Clostridiales bacterium]|nr:hypothetical protein [Clostridiales bacterium]
MENSKVKEFIQSLGAPTLTEKDIANIKAHHEYHGDKQLQIVGALPHGAVFVKVVDHIGYSDSVIDLLCYDDDCSEDCFIRNASERREINFIKRWLKRNLPDYELQKLMAEGKL